MDGDAVTYSAAGLPAGLSIDATSGLISGTVTAAGSYDVTATVSDGSLTASQTFTWDVSASGAEVTLAINGTLDHAGGVALVGAGATPVVVTLLHATPGEHDITLELPGESADLSSLSQTAFQLIDGGSLTVWLTALQPSAAEDDVQLLAFVDKDPQDPNPPIAGDGHLTNEQVTFAKDIKNADTPAGMADRIPPTAITPTTVTLNVTLTKGQVINLTVHGNSPANGDADFHDATGNHGFIELTKAGTNDISLVGTAQTQPSMTGGKADGKGGNAGNLKLHAFVFVNDVGRPRRGQQRLQRGGHPNRRQDRWCEPCQRRGHGDSRRPLPLQIRGKVRSHLPERFGNVAGPRRGWHIRADPDDQLNEGRPGNRRPTRRVDYQLFPCRRRLGRRQQRLFRELPRGRQRTSAHCGHGPAQGC